MSQRFWVILFLVSILIIFASWTTNVVHSGFGVGPPAVHNPNLLRGSHWEQKVYLLRSDPTEDLRVELSIEVPDNPEIKDWISIEPGTSFILPKGATDFPITVKVDVPKRARYKNYKGHINARTEPADQEAGVAIALGARIQIDLTVTDKPFPNFKVWSVEMLSLEECCGLKFKMKIENTGNVKVRPAKVELLVYHGYMIERLLHTAVVEERQLKWTGTNQTREIVAAFPLKGLKPGRYWAHIKIYKGDEIEREDKMFFTVFSGKKVKIFGRTYTFCKCLSGYYILIAVLVLAAIGYGIWRGARFGIKFRRKKRAKI